MSVGIWFGDEIDTCTEERTAKVSEMESSPVINFVYGIELLVFQLKSLILAQIERWRHALHMQVERQHGCLHLVASGERVSNTSERAQ